MIDWKACTPCDYNRLVWCPMLELFECPECGLAYDEDEYLEMRRKALGVVT